MYICRYVYRYTGILMYVCINFIPSYDREAFVFVHVSAYAQIQIYTYIFIYSRKKPIDVCDYYVCLYIYSHPGVDRIPGFSKMKKVIFQTHRENMADEAVSERTEG